MACVDVPPWVCREVVSYIWPIFWEAKVVLLWSDDESIATVMSGPVGHPPIAVEAADSTWMTWTWAVVCGLGVGSAANHSSGTLGADLTCYDSSTECPSLLPCWASFDTDTDAELVCCIDTHCCTADWPGVDCSVRASTCDIHKARYVAWDAGVVSGPFVGETDDPVKVPLYTCVCDV